MFVRNNDNIILWVLEPLYIHLKYHAPIYPGVYNTGNGFMEHVRFWHALVSNILFTIKDKNHNNHNRILLLFDLKNIYPDLLVGRGGESLDPMSLQDFLDRLSLHYANRVSAMQLTSLHQTAQLF